MIESDDTVNSVRQLLPAAVHDFDSLLQAASSEHFKHEIQRLDDIRESLLAVADASTVNGCEGLAKAIVRRHRDVQNGKFDGGRRKMPWIEESMRGFVLASTRVGGLDHEVTDPVEITPHPYRLQAADAWFEAGR